MTMVRSGNARRAAGVLSAAAWLGALGGSAGSAAAAVVDWGNWTFGTRDFPSSASVGVFPLSAASFSYTGSALILQTGSGTDYWSPSTAFVSPQVSNPPPAAHMAGVVDSAGSHALSLGVPTSGLVMAVVGLGTASTATDWVFNTPFTVLSSGPGFFGGPGTLAQLPGNVLRGFEGTGVIMFTGAVTSVSWTIVNGEQPWTNMGNITGMTVGLVPGPGAGLAVGAGLAAGLGRRRR
jgi:hypothetical protein